MSEAITYDDYLAHYGVKGMKWGVRKDRKSDDAKAASSAKKKARKQGSESLSNKELKDIQERRNLEKNSRAREKNRSKSSDDAKDVGGLKKVGSKKGTKALSNDELQAVITRMELEKKYSEISKGDSKTSAGRDFIKDVLTDAAKNVASSYVEDMMRNAGNATRKRYNARRATPREVSSGPRQIGS